MKRHHLLAATALVCVLPSNARATTIYGTAAAGEELGYSVAAGNFDGNAYMDLAIGAPNTQIGVDAQAGAVNVLYGTSSGLGTTGQDYWSEDSTGTPDATADAGDQFGSAVAAGDFNCDGYDDLAVGVPYEDVDGETEAGAVDIFYGSSGGLTTSDNFNHFTQDDESHSALEEYDHFGWAVAAGDFDGDDCADLAVGVPGEDIGGISGVGAVNVFYGSEDGLTTTGSEEWDQGVELEGSLGDGDNFGTALVTGYFNDDGFADLAVGAPYEDVGSAPNYGAGAVNVIYGSRDGLDSDGNDLWHQDVTDVKGEAGYFDHFGFALAAGDFDCDDIDDLAIGSPRDLVLEDGVGADGGSVNVLYGSDDGLTNSYDEFWSQLGDLEGAIEDEDFFGFSLAAGSFDGDSCDDLAIGVESEGIATWDANEGAVNVIYGATTGLVYTDNQIWYQGSAKSLLDSAETEDRFGWALAAGNFNGDANHRDDLAIGIPFENIGTVSNAGAVSVIYGTSSTYGLTGTGDQFFSQ